LLCSGCIGITTRFSRSDVILCVSVFSVLGAQASSPANVDLLVLEYGE
jgi:hypothetical protein